MRWALWTVGIIVGLIAVVVVVGMMLPQSHVASRSAHLRAAPERVWASLTNVDEYAAWHPGVRSVDVLPSVNGRASWLERSKDGAITYVVTDAEPPRRLVTRIADRNLPYGGEWETVLEPDSDGTRVTITERGEIYNPVFRSLARFVFGYTAAMDATLDALERRVMGKG